MKNKIKTEHGFTLIELMVTVVIIGIISAMAVPRFAKEYDRMTFRTATKKVSSTIRLARSMAISQKDYYGVHFDATARTVTLYKKADTSSFYNVYQTSDSAIRVDTLSREFTTLTTDLTNSAIAFRPNGSAIFAGGGNIACMIYNDNIIGINQINVLASTGRVKSDGYYY